MGVFMYSEPIGSLLAGHVYHTVMKGDDEMDKSAITDPVTRISGLRSLNVTASATPRG